MKKSILIAMLLLTTQISFAEELRIYSSQDEAFNTVVMKVQNKQLKCIRRIRDFAHDSLNVIDGLLNWSIAERRVMVINSENHIDTYSFFNDAKELYFASGLENINKCEYFSHTGVFQNLL